MLVAREQEEANVFIFVPRFYATEVVVVLTDQTRGEPVNIEDPEIEYKKGYAYLKLDYSFSVGSTYPIDVREKGTNKIVFKSQIICTNQNPQVYEQSND